MTLRILDTSVLVQFWNRARGQSSADEIEADSGQLAENLIASQKTDAILTPVYLEFVAGSQNEHELAAFRLFLARFRIVDNGRILPEDWKEARRLAERVPRDGQRRHLGDCLIRAIAWRLKRDVITLDKRFPGSGR